MSSRGSLLDPQGWEGGGKSRWHQEGRPENKEDTTGPWPIGGKKKRASCPT